MAGRPATASDRKQVPRYRFSEFILSPRRRMLLRNGREQPLIPRYFDLLVFLIERRGDAVHRRDIFDRVWGDVVVSDSALSQAIRTIRRVLGDDSREPRFVRTVSRHGYQLRLRRRHRGGRRGRVAEWSRRAARARRAPSDAAPIRFEPLLERLTRVATTRGEEEDQREAAELLHALGYVRGLAAPRHPSAPRVRASAAPRHALGLGGSGPGARSAVSPAPSGRPRTGPAETAPGRCHGRRAMGTARRSAAAWPASLGGAAGGADSAGRPGQHRTLRAGPGAGRDRRMLPARPAVPASAPDCRWPRPLPDRGAPLVLVCGAALGGGLAGYLAQWLGRWTPAALVGISVDTRRGPRRPRHRRGGRPRLWPDDRAPERRHGGAARTPASADCRVDRRRVRPRRAGADDRRAGRWSAARST